MTRAGGTRPRSSTRGLGDAPNWPGRSWSRDWPSSSPGRVVLARRDDPALADHLQRVARFLNEMPNLFEREVILGSVILGEIGLERDDLPTAERWSARAQVALRRYPDAGMLRPRAERLRLALQERRLGEAVTARRAARPRPPAHSALSQRDRRAVVHLTQHDEEPHALAVCEARRALADRGRRAGARARPAQVRPLRLASRPPARLRTSAGQVLVLSAAHHKSRATITPLVRCGRRASVLA